MTKPVFDKNRQPQFSTLRPLGNFSGLTPNPDISYEDLWKHDEYIHHLPNRVNVQSIKPPAPPSKLKAFRYFKYKQELADYAQKQTEYEEALSEAQKLNVLHDLHDTVKQEADYFCYFCGFRDERFIEIHHLDGNHFRNDKSNLVAACTLCHRQHHLLWLSMYDHAELGVANMPHLTQTELNHIQRIAIVMKDHPSYAGLLGVDGKLGTMLNDLTFGFSRPLHAFMIPDKEKEKHWNQYVQTQKLTNPSNGNSANYLLIDLALAHINNLKPNKQQKDALDQYDAFIGLIEQKRADANASDEDIRNKFASVVREMMTQYKKVYESEFERNFNEDRGSFSVFELAMALKTINYSDFKEFNPKYMYLVFKPEIFTEEQIAYYRTLEYFDVEKWGFGGH